MNRGFTVWLTGMSSSGKTTAARLLEARFRASGASVEVLDGDLVRTQLGKELGFSKADRDENVRRIGFLCELLSRNGIVAIAATISPYRAVRSEIRARIANFVEVYMECPLDVLIARDVKGLYKKALAGEIRAIHRRLGPLRAAVRSRGGDSFRPGNARGQRPANLGGTRTSRTGSRPSHHSYVVSAIPPLLPFGAARRSAKREGGRQTRHGPAGG